MKKLAKILTIQRTVVIIWISVLMAFVFPSIRDVFLAVTFSVWAIATNRDKLLNQKK